MYRVSGCSCNIKSTNVPAVGTPDFEVSKKYGETGYGHDKRGERHVPVPEACPIAPSIPLCSTNFMLVKFGLVDPCGIALKLFISLLSLQIP